MNENEKRPPSRIQLWCQNYEPEPLGVAPVAATLAKGLKGLGNEVLVLTAHPHYPQADWGTRLMPYREKRDGIPVLRLPIWPGRRSGMQRVRQDLSATVANTAIAPLMPKSDAVIAISPSLPALAATMLYSALHRVPWILWLQDIVTDGAVTTGELEAGSPVLRAARRFEKRAYSSADHIIVISRSFRSRLLEQGVPAEKISLVFNPMTRAPASPLDVDATFADRPSILTMGNIGRTQGLESIVEAFEANEELDAMGAELRIVGTGVAYDSVRSTVRSARVSMPGVVDDEGLDRLLGTCRLGLVSQRPGLREFNLPSKLMNYMAHGIPVLAAVHADSETARIVRESGAGWVTDPASPEEFARRSASVLTDPDALRKASEAGFRFANRHFSPTAVAMAMDEVVREVANARRGR